MVTQRQTDTHVYFWGGIYSNFYKRQQGFLFDAPLWNNGPQTRFYHSEGYYMAMKAMAFGDVIGHCTDAGYKPSALEEILRSPDPKTAKAFGRDVKKFDDPLWKTMGANMMFRGIWFKFLQNTDLGRTLVDTGTRKLVEGSPIDRIWGVGLAWNDPAIEDEANWKGGNALGEVLMVVRGLLAEMDVDEALAFNPFKVDLGLVLQ